MLNHGVFIAKELCSKEAVNCGGRGALISGLVFNHKNTVIIL